MDPDKRKIAIIDIGFGESKIRQALV